MKKLVLASSAVLLVCPANAQPTPPQGPAANGGTPISTATVAPPVPVVNNNGSAVLRVGTEVPLRLSQELTTKGKKLRVGDRFNLEVAEPIMINGIVVIPTGSPAKGEITDVVNKGMWGKSGKLSARVLYVTVSGRQIRLSGAFDDKGVAGGVGAAAVSAIVFLPAGFFMTGTSAKVPAGTIVKSFVDEDVPLNIAASAPAPLVIAPVAPVSVQAPTAAQSTPSAKGN